MARTPKKKDSELYFEKYDLYSDANPNDTISVKYNHARIVQVANVLKQRIRVIYDRTGKGIRRYRLIVRYFDFLTQERTPTKGFEKRKKLKFKI